MSTTETKNGLRAKLDEVNDQIESKRSALQAKNQAWDQARDEFLAAGNDANRTDSDEFKKVDSVGKEHSALAEEVADLESVRDGVFRMLGTDAPANGKPESALPSKQDPERKSLADRAIESEAYQALKASGVLNSDKRRLGGDVVLTDMSNAELMEMINPQAALLTGGSDTSGGAFIEPTRVGYVAQPRRMTRILDLITVGQTNSDSVRYARQTAFTNVAAETAEATSVAHGTKPEATIAFEIVNEAVKTIAHWIPATRQSLSDVAQLRTLIESQLRYGLEYRLESEVVAGNGSGENLTGIQNTTNILSQAKGSDSVADAIHKAITQIRLGFLEPNGVALHPNDWQLLRLARDDGGSIAGTGNYLYGPPALAGQEQIWGLPVAVTPAVSDDTGLVGDFRQATLWLREGAQVLASDSHDDFFVKNLVALLAEMRAAFGVLLPAAFCKVTSLD